MQLATTFRHMDASSAVKAYAIERLSKIRKYFHGDPIGAHATFAVERNHNHTAEFQITLPNGIMIQARETTEDMYSSIDLAGARIERQVRKWKDKIRDHKPHAGPAVSMRGRVLEAHGLEPGRGKGAGKGLAASAGKAPAGGARGLASGRAGAAGAKAGRRVSAGGALQPRGRNRIGRDGLAGGAVVRPSISAPVAPALKVIKEQRFTVRPLLVDDAVMQMNLLESEFFVFLDVDTKAVSVVYRRKDGNYGLIETGGRLDR